ncbi:hypothetical protein M2281_000845 [Mesorhizobium soli]|jgi:hypothetical protein|uniref:hypothetical protein n=1 Tax=Pseudaminobacter soli (ex Li et al. 2025) TaxID=1295366 RepID=UPI002474CAC7|nr:hypothetical protein [Mesorhizobium soli]MDH6230273.1 hypothetical protein [Mesorhizobium soli]
MRNLLLASIIAATSSLSFGGGAYAAQNNIGGMTSMPNYPAGSRVYSPDYMDRKCVMKTVRRHRNGQVVLEKVKTCH